MVFTNVSDCKKATLSFAFIGILLAGFCDAQESCTFRRQKSRVGDVTDQQLVCDLNLQMAVRQGEQVVDSKKQAVTRKQNRRITILTIGDAAPTRASVTYNTSSISLKQTDGREQSSSQPVAGHTYYVTREGKELKITDIQGNVPPPEELMIVRSNLEAFGLPNPIANYFAGKTIRVGQTVELPIEIAKELLGFQETLGDVTGLKMKLIRMQPTGTSTAAIFETALRAENDGQSGVRLQLKGQMALDVQSCRTLGMNLSGPVSVEEEHGPPEGRFSVTSEGDIQVAVRATYSNVTQRR